MTNSNIYIYIYLYILIFIFEYEIYDFILHTILSILFFYVNIAFLMVVRVKTAKRKS